MPSRARRSHRIPVHQFSHLGGFEIVQTRFSGLEREIRELIGSVLSPSKTKISREETRLGRALDAPKGLNELLKVEFRHSGWNAKRVNLTIEIPGLKPDAKPFKEIDFLKERVAADVRFGKYFSMQYDLQKFQYFYNIGEIEVGVEILPMNRLRKQMPSGVLRQFRNFLKGHCRITVKPFVLRGHLAGAIGESPRRVNQDRCKRRRKIFQDRFACGVQYDASRGCRLARDGYACHRVGHWR
jgi:hypothetical protein